MRDERGPLTYATLADNDYRPLGIIERHRTGWTAACDQCRHTAEVTTADAGVTELIVHIEQLHP